MKTILITGASGGIGAEIAKTLAKKSNNLILVYNNHKPNIAEFKTRCCVDLFQCDLTNTDAIKNMVDKIILTDNASADACINLLADSFLLWATARYAPIELYTCMLGHKLVEVSTRYNMETSSAKILSLEIMIITHRLSIHYINL